jgi:hypothetical protein
VVEPETTPLTANEGGHQLRSQDGALSPAPAFLQARPERPEAEAGEARRPRRRRAPRSLKATPARLPRPRRKRFKNPSPSRGEGQGWGWRQSIPGYGAGGEPPLAPFSFELVRAPPSPTLPPLEGEGLVP